MLRTQTQSRGKAAADAPWAPLQGVLLQRKCDCGQHTIAGGECMECQRKSGRNLSRAGVNQAAASCFTSSEVPERFAATGREAHEQKTLAGTDFNQPGGTGGRLYARPQLQIAVEPAGDQFELEADRVAERLKDPPASQSLANEQRFMKEPEPIISRKSDRDGGVAVSAEQESEIEALMHGGESLPASVRDSFETRFGYDFSRVRVHTSERAAVSTTALDANAFTLGSHIVFAKNRYDPTTEEGSRLLAHELTHVVQQGAPARSAQGAAPSARRTASRSHIQRDVAADRKEAATQLGAASSSAESRQRDAKEQAPNLIDLTGLKPDQSTSIVAAVKRLEGMTGSFQSGVTNLDGIHRQLNDSVKFLKAARTAEAKGDASGKHLNLSKAVSAIGDAAKSVKTIGNLFALGKISNQVDAELQTITQFRDGGSTGDIGDAIDSVTQTAKAVAKVSDDAKELPNAIAQVVLVFKNFLASNKVGGFAPLSADEAKKLKAAVDGFDEHLKLIFPDTDALTFRLFTDYAAQLEKQIDFKAKMATEREDPAALVPEQGEAVSFFGALKKKPNNDVRQAYAEYAAAYFYHRGISSREDLQVKSLGPLFARTQSIAGLRPLVCTGYAFLGSQLFAQAGGKLKEFFIGARVSDAELLSAKGFSDVHALAAVTRDGETFFVSNDGTVNSDDAGFAPNAVGWDHKDNPLYVEKGKSISEIVSKLEARLQRERENKKKPK